WRLTRSALPSKYGRVGAHITREVRGREWRCENQLRLHGAFRASVQRVERCRAADVKPVSLLASEAHIGNGLRQMNLADQVAFGIVAANAILLGVTPTHGAPDIPIGVAAHAVGKARSEVFGEDLAIRQLARIDIDVEYTDPRRISLSLREARVDDVELLLVGRERNTIGHHEIVGDDLDVAGFWIDPEDVALVLFERLLEAFIVALDPIARIREP